VEAEDPVLGRLDDALTRVNRIEERAVSGENIPNNVIISEMRAIRDDMIAERRDVLQKRKEIEEHLLNYLPRQPAVNIIRWVVGFITTLGGAWVLWYLTGKN
jgi:hypothetical protein